MKYYKRGVAPPIALALFVILCLAKLAFDGRWTLEAKLAVGILSFSLVGGLLIGLTAWLYGVFERRKKSRK
jgi:uncharacterized integral membrane protein